MSSAGSKAVKAGLKEIIDLVEDYIASGGDIKKIPTGKRSMTEAQMKKQVKQKGKLIPENPRLKGEEAAARPSYLQRPAGKKRTQAGSQKGLSGKQKPNLRQLPLRSKLHQGEFHALPQAPQQSKKKFDWEPKEPTPAQKKKGKLAAKLKSLLKDGLITPEEGERALKRGSLEGLKVKKIKAKKKKSDTSWMSGLSSDEIKSILGITTVDPITGIRGHRKKGGQVLQKRHGGMTRVGLSPAEEARAGTMSEAKRARYMQGGGPIRTTFPRRADPRTKGRAPAVDLFPEVGRFAGGATALPEITKLLKRKAEQAGAKRKKSQEKKKKIDKDLVSTKNGGKVGKKEQGYKARKDESIAMRVKKKRTKKQLTASRHESYGKPGSGKGKGKINRISSKQTDGNKLVASLYD